MVQLDAAGGQQASAVIARAMTELELELGMEWSLDIGALAFTILVSHECSAATVCVL